MLSSSSATETFTHGVFLSHSAKDKAVVRASTLSASNGERAGVRCRSPRLTERFRADGLKVWPVPPKHLREGGFHEWVLRPGKGSLAQFRCFNMIRAPIYCSRWN
jgi:hypothetical protein